MNVILLTGVSGIIFQRSIGAYQLAHNLRQHDITCQVIDFIQDFTQKELIDYLEKFIKYNTVCIGVSTTFLSGTKVGLDNKSILTLVVPEHVEQCLIYIKQKYPKIKICLGGARSKNGLTKDYIDSIFYGYTEDEFLNYCTKLLRNKKDPFIKKINGKKIYDKENINFDIRTLNHRFIKNDCITSNETLPIEISRGCIFKCKFCAYPLNGKKKLDYIRCPKEIVEELKFNYYNYGVTNYFFADDTFNDSVEKIKALHDEVIKLPFKINFTCYLRLDLLYYHREMIPLLQNMGLLSAFFGIESFCQEALKTIGKNLQVEKIKNFLDELYYEWKEKISFSLGFIVGLPYETEESINQTVEWLKSRPYAFHFEPLRISDAGGSYKSEFEKNYLKYGYTVDKKGMWSNDFFNQETAETIAYKINRIYAYGENKPSSWMLMALLNHFDYGEIINTSSKNLKYKEILKSKKRRILQYKKMLNECNEDS